jgi:hypothetical protein
VSFENDLHKEDTRYRRGNHDWTGAIGKSVQSHLAVVGLDLCLGIRSCMLENRQRSGFSFLIREGWHLAHHNSIRIIFTILIIDCFSPSRSLRPSR